MVRQTFRGPNEAPGNRSVPSHHSYNCYDKSSPPDMNLQRGGKGGARSGQKVQWRSHQRLVPPEARALFDVLHIIAECAIGSGRGYESPLG